MVVESHNEFTVPAAPDEVFAVLLDLERIAPCMPGARLLESEGDSHRGSIRLKIGPILASYEGVVDIVDVDVDARCARLRASGAEVNGSGSAQGTVTAAVNGDGSGSTVTLATELQIRGTAAQFGRGVLTDVGQRVVDQFARNLEGVLLSGATRAEQPAAPVGGGQQAAEHTPAPTAQPRDSDETPGLEALPPLLRRAAPVVTAFLAGVLLGRLLGGRRHQPLVAGPPRWARPPEQ